MDSHLRYSPTRYLAPAESQFPGSMYADPDDANVKSGHPSGFDSPSRSGNGVVTDFEVQLNRLLRGYEALFHLHSREAIPSAAAAGHPLHEHGHGQSLPSKRSATTESSISSVRSRPTSRSDRPLSSSRRGQGTQPSTGRGFNSSTGSTLSSRNRRTEPNVELNDLVQLSAQRGVMSQPAKKPKKRRAGSRAKPRRAPSSAKGSPALPLYRSTRQLHTCYRGAGQKKNFTSQVHCAACNGFVTPQHCTFLRMTSTMARQKK
jgi:hypothetical protein